MINSATKMQTYRFEDVEVDIARGCLLRHHQEQHLRQKTFQVLVYLLDRRERLVPKEELMKAVWKDTAVTDDALVQSIKEIRRALGDNSHNPRFIKTVPKAGYRFIGSLEECRADAPVIVETEEITRVEVEFEEESDFAQNVPFTQNLPALNFKKAGVAKQVLFPSLAFVFVAALAGFVYFNQSRVEEKNTVILPQMSGKKPIAVMFFENPTQNAELDWLREGIADMLIADFSRSAKLTVLSRGQLQLLLERIKRRSTDKIELGEALEIARKTGAEAIITGSFARIENKVRFDVQLHDARTGGLLTAESLVVDRPEQILSEIDLLSIKLLKRLDASPEIMENQEGLSRVMTNNLEAYRYYSLALEKARGYHQKDALKLLEKAVALDPEFAMAHARIGYTYAVTWGWGEKAKPHLERAFALSDHLTEKDRLYISAWYGIANIDYPAAIQYFREIVRKYPTETEAYLRLSYLLKGEEQIEEAINALRQGLTIDPDSSPLYNALGLLYSLQGKHEEAFTAHRHYVALEPNEANAHDSLGMSYQWAGRYDEAIGEYNRALELNQDFEIAYVHLGTAYFQTGRCQKAIDWFKRYVSVAPSELERSRGYVYIAHVYRRLKNFAAATVAANQAIKENEFSVSEQFLIASESGDLATMKKLEQKLFAKSGFSNRGYRLTSRFGFYYRGKIALKNGQTEEALENFREALRRSPATWDIDALEDCLANAYLELRRFDDAIGEYERILRLNPNYPLARFYLAQAYEGKGLNEEARANYLQFLEIWKDADKNIPEIKTAKKFLGES